MNGSSTHCGWAVCRISSREGGGRGGRRYATSYNALCFAPVSAAVRLPLRPDTYINLALIRTAHGSFFPFYCQ